MINLKGELVGLTTTASSPSGFDAQAGYAIPMDRMGRRIVETLKQGKEVEYGLLGIRAEDGKVNRITNVSPNSPAGRGVLQVGDAIVGVNGEPISSFDSLILAVGIYPPGEPIGLKIRRGGKLIERTLVLAKYPIPGEVIATNRPKPWRGLRVDYATTAMNSAHQRLRPGPDGRRRDRHQGRARFAGRLGGVEEGTADPPRRRPPRAEPSGVRRGRRGARRPRDPRHRDRRRDRLRPGVCAARSPTTGLAVRNPSPDQR